MSCFAVARLSSVTTSSKFMEIPLNMHVASSTCLSKDNDECPINS
jgi:hypothetical protein